ncbi:MAG: terminase TerL endonuclease subunit [Dysosmobacter sp.]|nr:terminase TerL endonuclease subunit [Dysosmobacter sp.]
MIKTSRAYLYAKWCVQKGNRKVGKYVKLQAKKWLRIADGKHKEAYVSEKAYRKICKLLKLMVHPDLQCSMYDGLEDYAWFLIVAVFCTLRRSDDRRFYQTALLEIARKNFKTFNSAVIFILGMLTEPRFSRFFSVAPDYKLSSELRLAVRKIIKVSPALTKYFKVNRDMITCLINEIEYTPLAYSNDGMDGRLANIFLADEAGALDSYPVEAMRSSQITLVNKLGIIISTQYPNDNNVMIDEIDIAKKVLDEVLDKENVFALLYEPDDALRKRWETDDLAIYQANPVAVNNPEIFQSIKDLRTMAVLYENKRENFLCKHLNIMYKGLGVEGYVDVQKVKRCRIEADPAWWKGRRVWVGLDLAQTDDNTAVSMVTEDDGKIYAKVWGILPKDKVEIKSTKEDVDYKKLIAAGCCFAEGEEVIDYGFVERWILGLEKKFGVEIVQIGFDRYNAISTVQKLEAEGYECVEVKQHSSVLHPPTKLLREAILKQEFAYEENRLLEINFQNARCTEDTNLNKYVNKKRSAGKVDMVMAIIDAVYLMQVEQLSGVNWGIQVIT